MVVINPTVSENQTRFRWTYIVLPVVFLLLSLILTACFYARLPESIAYHFQGDSPDKWLSRGAFIAWMIIPQVFFVVLSWAIVRVVLLAARYMPPEGTPLPKLLPVMGNMMALPQIVLFFALLNFLLYNAYQIKVIPLWIITLIVLVLGGIYLAIFFTRTIRRFRRQQSKSLRE